MSHIVKTLTDDISDEALREELRRLEERRAELRHKRKLRGLARSKERAAARGEKKSHHKPPDPHPEPVPGSDFLFGARAIAEFLGRTRAQVYYDHAAGSFGSAVWKHSEKCLAGSKSRLRNLGPQE
jgi:hypothetical protein